MWVDVIWMTLLGLSCCVAGWDAEWGKVNRLHRPLILSEYETLFGLNAFFAIFGVVVTVGFFWTQAGFTAALTHFVIAFACFLVGDKIVTRILTAYVFLVRR